jgi:hypothetical protein
LLLFIKEAIKVVEMLDFSFIDHLSPSYSELMSQLQWPPHPVVLALSGIEASRLSGENGGPPDLSLLEQFQGIKRILIQSAFRVADVSATDVRAIYDLKAITTDDPYSLSGVLDSCRTSTSDWAISGE